MQVAYWRYPTYNAVRFSFTAFFGFVLGTTFWRIGQDRCDLKSLHLCAQGGALGARFCWDQSAQVGCELLRLQLGLCHHLAVPQAADTPRPILCCES